MAIQLPYTDGFITPPDPNNPEFKNNKGQANGYAPLDANAKVPTENLPDQASLDAEVDGKISTHNSATTSVHGIANTSDILTKNGGALNQGANLTLSDGSNDSEIGAWGFGVENTNGDSIYVDPTEIGLNNGAKLKKGTTDGGLGGYKGIALKCSVDYELKWEAGRLYTMQQDGFTIRSVEHCMTAPTSNDDETKGYVVGTRWVMDSWKTYVCTHAGEGNADWELRFSQDNPSQAGYINTSGDAGGQSGGYIDTSAGNGGSGGGYINTSGSDGYGGYIDTRGSNSGADGGNINTSAGSNGSGGNINTSHGGGYINTSGDETLNSFGGSINTSGKEANGGCIDTSDHGFGNGGGSILTYDGGSTGGTIDTHGSAWGAGGSINTSGGNVPFSSGAGGSINTSNGGGSINTSGDNDGGHGGSISTYSLNGNAGGYINTTGIDWTGGYINTSSVENRGGYIDTSGGSMGDGGSINTSDGGGSINTRGTGSIELGSSGTRTTIVGSATSNRALTLPNNSGTIALLEKTQRINFSGTLDSYNIPASGASTYVISNYLSSTATIYLPRGISNISGQDEGARDGDIAIFFITNSALNASTTIKQSQFTGQGYNLSGTQYTYATIATYDNFVNNTASTNIICKFRSGTWELLSYKPQTHIHGNITNAGAIGSTANLPLITTTSGVVTTGSFGTTANSFCQGNDSRLSDARAPLSHTHGNITNAGAVGTTANLPLITTTSGVVTTGTFGTTANSFCQGNDVRLSDARTPTAHKSSHATGGSDALTPSDIGAQPAGNYAPATGISPSAITGTAVITTDSRLSDARTPTSHTHGNITNAGAIGSTANLPLITTTSGVVTTGSFGTTANSFCQGNDSRLSDSRTPTSHALSHAAGSGSDPITPSMIGAAPAGHTHAISDVTSLQTTLDGKWISFPTSFAVWTTGATGADAGYFGDIEATGTTSSVALRSFAFPFNAKLVGASASIYNTSTTNTLPSGATITISLYSKASEAATTATKVVDTNNWSLASNVAATATTTNARTFTATDISAGTIYVMGISVSALPSASIRGKVVLYFR